MENVKKFILIILLCFGAIFVMTACNKTPEIENNNTNIKTEEKVLSSQENNTSVDKTQKDVDKETIQIESTKQENSIQESSEKESIKQESSEKESIKQESSEIESTKQESSEIESTKQESSEIESAKQENNSQESSEKDSVVYETPWYYSHINVRTYPALEKADVVESDYNSLAGLSVNNQDCGASDEDTDALIAITERFADLTENTFERKYDEVADWCYLSISECWSVIDEWNKMSQLVRYKIMDISYQNKDYCIVDIVEYVNDNYNEESGLYNGEFKRTGKWTGHLHYVRTETGWFLDSENYDFDF